MADLSGGPDGCADVPTNGDEETWQEAEAARADLLAESVAFKDCVITRGWPMAMRHRVWFSEIDARNHVNNCVPLVWFQEARIAYMKLVTQAAGGESLWLVDGEPVGRIVASNKVTYLRQVKRDEVLEFRVRCKSFGTRSYVVEIEIYSVTQAAVTHRGEVVMVAFNYGRNRSIPLWPELRAAVRAVEAPRHIPASPVKSKL